ncbi:hypothetical protein ETB97_004328 [Aspergillus alliaceus]|uniref:Aminoglycoside phosphotransferase domain-containing protein n=1 Tax=Petromyces alliaceus TaxID=209559 RepID=A0A8H5ZZ38_PETAA|nr:hypothetical protein ETB97_004328 [Aspergillus burnettii]
MKLRPELPPKTLPQGTIQCQELYNFHGNRVFSSTTANGLTVALYIKPTEGFARSEADMLHYVSLQPGITAPKVLGCYDVPRDLIAMVTDLLEGESLDTVWYSKTKTEQKSINAQLEEQIWLFRKYTQPYIGRVGRQETLNFYFYDRLHFNFMWPFGSEEELDCLGQVRSSTERNIWGRLLPGTRAEQKFVLTHEDLAARNFMMKDGKITGIEDWGV